MPVPEKTTRDQFTVNFTCHGCGQKGSSLWEENSGPDPRGPQPSVVSISAGFYERICKKSPFDIEVVCHQCGSVQLG